MKRILMLLMVALCLPSLKSMGQAPLIPAQTSTDYSPYILVTQGQTWKLTGIAHNDALTGLFFRIDVTNNKEGSFAFPKDIYISGEFGSYHPIGLKVEEKDFELGKYWRYYSGNKGKGADVLLIFPRIPAGISSINYCEPNFIRWDNIPITDNPDPAEKTNWTDASLRAHWSENRCLPIEGIYYFTNTTSKEWWGENKHTLAVIKDDYQYKLLYICQALQSPKAEILLKPYQGKLLNLLHRYSKAFRIFCLHCQNSLMQDICTQGCVNVFAVGRLMMPALFSDFHRQHLKAL